LDRTNGQGQLFDKLHYGYDISRNNQLKQVKDEMGASSVSNDFDNYESYEYDEIGNLIELQTPTETSRMTWTIYGKLATVIKENQATNILTTVTYLYDAMGHRVHKSVVKEDNSGSMSSSRGNYQTTYWRDAQGNVLKSSSRGFVEDLNGVRTSKNSEEFVIYGSSRLGTYSPVYIASSPSLAPLFSGMAVNTLTLGYKAYELSNHLGNVLTTISDNYAPQPPTGGVSARVLSSQDYFPFGMVMTERSFVEKQERKYRWGFNTQERDEDIDEGGNHYTAEFWEYDSRIGRRWNLDPKPQINISDYAVNGNSPIWFQDELGDEAEQGVGPKPIRFAKLFFKPKKYKSRGEVEGTDQHYLGDLLPEGWKNGILEKILGSKGLNLAQQYGKWHKENLDAFAGLFGKGKKGATEVDEAAAAALKKAGLDPDKVTKIQTEVSFKVITKEGKEVDVRLDAVAQTKEGKFIPIEVKTGNASLSYGQEAFAKAMAEGGQIIPVGKNAINIFKKDKVGTNVIEQMQSKLKLIRFDGMIPRNPLGGVER
jgi:hypothetical protein